MASLHPPISMQITLTPSDLAEARVLLPHQIRVWGNQVDDILVLVDLPPWRPRNQAAQQAQQELAGFLDRQRTLHPHLAWKPMDYSREAVARVQETFYGGRPVPMHDCRNRPIYGYLHLLLATRHDLGFHIVGDMMFGGGSQTWMAEALDQLTRRPELLACNPLPGPPRPDGKLLSQRVSPTAEPGASYVYRFPTLSYRVFLLDRRVMAGRLAPLRTEWPSPLRSVASVLRNRRRPHALLEQVIAHAMRRQGQWRLDFLGVGPGMWSLHPRIRGSRFKRALPELLRLVEAEEVHPRQRGEYDLTEEMLRMAESGGRVPARRAG
jgi:hypothetical protein